MARLHKRSFSTFGNLDRMLDWIYIEFAMVIHCWVLLWVLVRRWKSVKAPVVKAGTKRKREGEKRKREILILREQWNPQPTCAKTSCMIRYMTEFRFSCILKYYFSVLLHFSLMETVCNMSTTGQGSDICILNNNNNNKNYFLFKSH